LQRKYKLPVRQFVIYLGNQRPVMRTQLPEEQIITGYELRNIQEYDYEQLVLSDIPQEIILAIPGDFHGEQPEKVIRQILERLLQISQGKLELQKYVRQLNMLSRLRKLQVETTKITAAMPIQLDFDVETDILYQQGIEQEKKEAITEMLKDGFLSLEQIAKYQRTSVEEVQEIKAALEKQ
jgi:hypothetical protein